MANRSWSAIQQVLGRTLVAATIVVAFAGCAAPGAPAVAPSAASTGDGSAAALVATLAAAGLQCADLEPRDPATYVADTVACSLGADDVIIRTFSSTENRDRYVAIAKEFTDQMSLDLDAPPQLIGPTWIVTTDTEATASRIRAVLGGELR